MKRFAKEGNDYEKTISISGRGSIVGWLQRKRSGFIWIVGIIRFIWNIGFISKWRQQRLVMQNWWMTMSWSWVWEQRVR